MHLGLTADQAELAQVLREFCADRFGVETLRSLEGTGFDRGLWGELADMGVFAARLPEDAGGTGFGTADAVVVFEELGRAIVPGPVLWTHLAAGIVDGAASGETVVGGLDLTEGPDQILLAEHLGSCDQLLGLYPDRVVAWPVASLESEPVAASLDPLTPVQRVRDLPDGKVVGDAAAARRMRAEATTFTAAFEVGLADAVTAMAAEYALNREQFGRPIGAFQAVKHILADMVVRTEVARSAVYAAGATLDGLLHGSASEHEAERIVHAAKITADTAADKNARACIQVHGGMGYTWEVPAHYYLKRAWVIETSFGSPAAHADAVAADLV